MLKIAPIPDEAYEICDKYAKDCDLTADESSEEDHTTSAYDDPHLFEDLNTTPYSIESSTTLKFVSDPPIFQTPL